MTGDGSKVWCCKEHCIGAWNVTLGPWIKINWFKEEMEKVNIDILGIRELKWMGKCEFNSDDHCIYYCGQESLRRNAAAIRVNKSPKCSTWVKSQKWQNDLCSFPRQTIQYLSNPSLCPNLSRWRSCRFHEGLQDLLELTPKKDVLFIIGDWNAKVGSHEIPGIKIPN